MHRDLLVPSPSGVKHKFYLPSDVSLDTGYLSFMKDVDGDSNRVLAFQFAHKKARRKRECKNLVLHKHLQTNAADVFDFGLKKHIILKTPEIYCRVDIEDWSFDEEIDQYKCTVFDLVEWDQETLSPEIWSLKRRAFYLIDDGDCKQFKIKQYKIPDEDNEIFTTDELLE